MSFINKTGCRLKSGLLIAILIVTVSGCQTGRKWFQIDSNSQMPYFGLELMPRRSAMLTPTSQPEHQALLDGRQTVELTSRKQSEQREPIKPLTLPKISDDIEELSFTGPQTPFSR